MKRILVVDDHPIVRAGVRVALVEALGEELEVVGEAGTGAEALAALDGARWDLVLRDLSLPGRSGLGLLGEITHRHPRVPVLVLSVHPEEEYAVRALRQGASGYLSKLATTSEIAKAIARVAAGRRYVSEAIADQLSTIVVRGADSRERLSNRELDVLQGIGTGKTVREIADEMCLSVKTVSTYRARLLAKLELRTNAQLVRYAFGHAFVT